MPSLYHCGGGDRLTELDPLRELVAWVERGSAPERIIATGRDPQGNITRTRPVFPYPQTARYDGSGSIDDEANFAAATPPAPSPDKIRWVGGYLYYVPGPVAP